VVVDLTSAVKELIENALDSKASVVEIRLHDMGATCIEVSDNGSGICPADYHGS
jgi:DNA mismatch repair protein PMS2